MLNLKDPITRLCETRDTSLYFLLHCLAAGKGIQEEAGSRKQEVCHIVKE
jgi:hypothetical protein